MNPRLATYAPFFLAALGGSLFAQVPGGTLDPTTIPKYTTPLVIPPAMPRTSVLSDHGQAVDYYEIAVRQFVQQILPAGMPVTTVWGYGSVNHPGTFNYPSFTIEADYRRPVRVKWINGLVDAQGRYLPHLLAVDQTLHWANPPGPRDSHAMDGTAYTGPVPMVVHVHGAETTQESDGYPEAWFLPNASNIPTGMFRTGTYYDLFKASSPLGNLWTPGASVSQYPNDMYATTLWYHDHSLGMTRLNVYAGPAGFYMVRGGPGDVVTGRLPGPAPDLGDAAGKRYYEIPLAIQDRSFNADGSLFYPKDRAFFEGLTPDQLQIPFAPEPALGGPSDVSPIWNPEFFGNTMLVNGKTWPYLDVEPKRYRFRLLDGCNARFLILRPSLPVPMVQIGAEGGFLPKPVARTEILMAPAERADVIFDFSSFAVGTRIQLLNYGPDDPFPGGVPDEDFDIADPGTTGQVMEFRVVARVGTDPSTPALSLKLPSFPRLGNPSVVRKLTLNEMMSMTVNVSTDANGNVYEDPNGEPFGPTMAMLGTLNPNGTSNLLGWADPVTETPRVGATETWEISNFTVDAHPIHIHQTQFEVMARKNVLTGQVRSAEPWERGFKDTVIAYPGELTRVKLRFDLAGLFVWHCHIVEHEDNEMMRPMRVLPASGGN